MLSAFAGGSLFGQRVGSAEPRVLALHGWGGDSSQLVPSLGNLSGISLDLPGFGASPEPDEVWGAADYADAIAPVLGTFEKPPVVLGFSFGGRIAVALAANHPHLIDSIVLTGAPLLRVGTKAKASASYRFAKWANTKGLFSDESLEKQRKKRGSSDYRNASGIMRDILVKSVNETYEDELSRIAVRTSFVWGGNDTAAPVATIDAATELIAKRYVGTIKIINNADHFLPVTQPEAVAAVVASALDGR